MLVLNNRNTKTYKTGYIIDNDSKAELAFRYRGVDREEIDHTELFHIYLSWPAQPPAYNLSPYVCQPYFVFSKTGRWPSP